MPVDLEFPSWKVRIESDRFRTEYKLFESSCLNSVIAQMGKNFMQNLKKLESITEGPSVHLRRMM